MNHRLYIASWPNGTISIVSALSRRDLFLKLDEEAEPSEAKIKQVDFYDGVHITTNFTYGSNDKPMLDEHGNPELNWSLGEDAYGNAKTRKVVFK